MIPDFKKPFSTFTNENKNPASFIISQHYDARDLVVKRLVELYNDDFDINDKNLVYQVFYNYGLLKDGLISQTDINYITQEVNRRIV